MSDNTIELPNHTVELIDEPAADSPLYLATANAAHSLEQRVIDVRKEALVSSDILGDSHSSIVDVDACMGLGQLVKIVGWYDNEWGYSTRLLDLVAIVGTWIRSQQRAV